MLEAAAAAPQRLHEAKSGHAAVAYAATDCEVEALFFFFLFEDRNRLKFP